MIEWLPTLPDAENDSKTNDLILEGTSSDGCSTYLRPGSLLHHWCSDMLKAMKLLHDGAINGFIDVSSVDPELLRCLNAMSLSQEMMGESCRDGIDCRKAEETHGKNRIKQEDADRLIKICERLFSSRDSSYDIRIIIKSSNALREDEAIAQRKQETSSTEQDGFTVLQAHGLFLLAHFGYFAALLSGTWNRTVVRDACGVAEINMVDINPAALERVLQYSYTGSLSIISGEENVTGGAAAKDDGVSEASEREKEVGEYSEVMHLRCMETANRLIARELTAALEEAFLQRVVIGDYNVCKLFVLADQQSFTGLRKMCAGYLIKHLGRIRHLPAAGAAAGLPAQSLCSSHANTQSALTEGRDHESSMFSTTGTCEIQQEEQHEEEEDEREKVHCQSTAEESKPRLASRASVSNGEAEHGFYSAGDYLLIHPAHIASLEILHNFARRYADGGLTLDGSLVDVRELLAVAFEALRETAERYVEAAEQNDIELAECIEDLHLCCAALQIPPPPHLFSLPLSPSPLFATAGAGTATAAPDAAHASSSSGGCASDEERGSCGDEQGGGIEVDANMEIDVVNIDHRQSGRGVEEEKQVFCGKEEDLDEEAQAQLRPGSALTGEALEFDQWLKGCIARRRSQKAPSTALKHSVSSSATAAAAAAEEGFEPGSNQYDNIQPLPRLSSPTQRESRRMERVEYLQILAMQCGGVSGEWVASSPKSDSFSSFSRFNISCFWSNAASCNAAAVFKENSSQEGRNPVVFASEAQRIAHKHMAREYEETQRRVEWLRKVDARLCAQRDKIETEWAFQQRQREAFVSIAGEMEIKDLFFL